MAFTPGLFTALTLLGGPGQPISVLEETASASDTASVSVSESVTLDDLLEVTAGDDTATVSATEGTATIVTVEPQVTDLSLLGVPGTYNELGSKTAAMLVDWIVSDDALASATEGPVDAQLVETSDQAAVSVSEQAPDVLVALDSVDDALASAFESVSLSITGSVDFDLIDSASVSASESVALDASSDVIDDAAVSASELSDLVQDAVDTTVTIDVSDTATASASEAVDELLQDPQAIDVTDTASASASEVVVQDVFTGEVELPASDDCAVAVIEVVHLAIIEGQVGFLRGVVSFVPALSGQPSIVPEQ